MTNWRAVLIGFTIILVVSIVGIALPGLGQLTAGLVGGFLAGYLAGGGLGSGFWHGLLAGSIGGIIGGLIVGLAVWIVGIPFGPVGAAFSGLLGVGIFAFAVFLALVMALESAIAGAVGGLLNDDRPSSPPVQTR